MTNFSNPLQNFPVSPGRHAVCPTIDPGVRIAITASGLRTLSPEDSRVIGLRIAASSPQNNCMLCAGRASSSGSPSLSQLSIVEAVAHLPRTPTVMRVSPRRQSKKIQLSAVSPAVAPNADVYGSATVPPAYLLWFNQVW